MRTLVYTAVTGGYDELREFPKLDDVDYVAFVEPPTESPHWECRPIPHEFPRRKWDRQRLRARWPKCIDPLAELYDRTVWIDANIDLDMESLLKESEDPGLYAMPHPCRNCIYREAVVVEQCLLDEPNRIRRQMNRYVREGYPVDNGLVEAGVVVRHPTDQIRVFSHLWCEIVCNQSSRDQLSFNYVAWKLGIPVRILGTPYERRKHKGARALWNSR